MYVVYNVWVCTCSLLCGSWCGVLVCRKEYQERLKRVTESTTRSHELKLLEAMNALVRGTRMTEQLISANKMYCHHFPLYNQGIAYSRRCTIEQQYL